MGDMVSDLCDRMRAHPDYYEALKPEVMIHATVIDSSLDPSFTDFTICGRLVDAVKGDPDGGVSPAYWVKVRNKPDHLHQSRISRKGMVFLVSDGRGHMILRDNNTGESGDDYFIRDMDVSVSVDIPEPSPTQQKLDGYTGTLIADGEG